MSKVFIRIQGASIAGFGAIVLANHELGSSVTLFPDILGIIALVVGLYAITGSKIYLPFWCHYVGYMLVAFNFLVTILSILDWFHGQPNLMFWMSGTILLFELEGIARSGVECG